MVIISIDLGDVRTGIAACDKNEILAYPLSVIEEKSRKKLAHKIMENAKKISAETIVIGLPKNMDGSLGESAKKIKKFSEMLKKLTNIPIILWDERLSTVSAASSLNHINIRGEKRKKIIDALSASIILENYLKLRKIKSKI